jgi:hypothetical protein
MATLHVTPQGLDRAIARVDAMPAQIARAVRRATRKAAKQTEPFVRSGMAGTLETTQRAVKARVSSRMIRDAGVVWIGLNPLVPTHLWKTVSQNKAGVQAGPQFFRGAFLASIYSSDRKVWMRRASPHWDAERYPYKPTGRGFSGEVSRGRFPVVLGRVPLDIPEMHDVVRQAADRAGQILPRILGQELNYEVNVRGGA